MPLSKIDSDSLNTPITAADLAYTGTLTGSTGIVNIGSGQVYKDASGNVGIGTSSPTAKLHVVSSGNPALFESTAANKKLLVQETTDSNANGGISIDKKHSTLHPANYWYGDIAFRGWDGSAFITGALIEAVAQGTPSASNMPGNLRFSTNSGGSSATERMRITSSGATRIGGSFTSGASKLAVNNTNNVSGDQNTVFELGANCNNTSSYHLICVTGTNDKLYIYGNGNVQNVNNSYGALSDVKLKENIVDASPKLDKLNQVRIVNFNMIGAEQKQLGVIAQELEQIFPGMVEESPDRDAEGNDLGTTTKGVKYSVFVPMLIKSIQELKAIVDGQAVLIAAQGVEIAALKGTP